MPELKEFIVELQTMSSMLECTTILLSNVPAERALAAEHTMVDGLIELRTRTTGHRIIRELEVLKFRGSDHFLGGQQMEIGSSGIMVYPKTEELLHRRALSGPSSSARVSTGITNLDTMLGGGFRAHSASMLFGYAGSGKTTFGLHFLHAGLAKKEHALHFGFYESPALLTLSAKRIGLDFAPFVKSGLMHFDWQHPPGSGLDALAQRLLHDVTARKVRRLVIDDIDGFWQSSADPDRSLLFTIALLNELRGRGVTMIINSQTRHLFGPRVDVKIEGIPALMDNLILLEYFDPSTDYKRLLTIVKQRASGYAAETRAISIGKKGLTVASGPTMPGSTVRTLDGRGSRGSSH